MRNILKSVEMWFLMRIFRREARQGRGNGQFHNPTRFYVLIHEAWAEVYREDNAPTVDVYLRECFEASGYELKEKKRQADREALIGRLSKYERELLGV